MTELLHRMSEGPDRERPARAALRRRSATARCRSSTGSRTSASWVDAAGRPAALPGRGRPRPRLHARRARGPRGGRDRARPLAVRGPRAGRLGRRRRGPVDRERAPPGAAARPRRGAARLARPDRRGRHRRAPPARAQPARRRPAAARRALADAAPRPGQAAQGPRRRRDSCSPARRRSSTRALEELRELARGIHPAVLSDRGLRAGARGARRPLAGAGRAGGHAARAAARRGRGRGLLRRRRGADQRRQVRQRLAGARVSVSRNNGHAVVEVADDGVGGADPERGSGLRGLADRVAALDGTLELRSPQGAGTLLRAEIPV